MDNNHCVICKRSFIEIGKYAKDMCGTCYQRTNRVSKERVNAKSRHKKCVSCNLEFNTINERGNIVKQGSGGYCKTCYMKQYHKKGEKNCLKCGRDLFRSLKSLCKICIDIERDEFYKNNPKARKTTTYLNRQRALNKPITEEQFETIRRILVLFKAGMYEYVYIFRLVDIYVEVFGNEAQLDAYTELDQIEIMLRKLKDIWLKNKVRFDEIRLKEAIKLKTKKKRLLKN